MRPPKEATNSTADIGCKTRAELERKARMLVELRAGRAIEEEEWGLMRGKLMRFYAILRQWEVQAREQSRDPKK